MVELFIPTEASRAIDAGMMKFNSEMSLWDLDGYILGMQKALNFGLFMSDDRIENNSMKIKQFHCIIRAAEYLRGFKDEMSNMRKYK